MTQPDKPAKTPATPQQTMLGCLILIAIVAVPIWFFFFRGSGSPGTTTPIQRPGAQTPAVTEAPVSFAPISLNGTGNKVATFTIPEGAAGIARMTYGGSGNFIVTSKAADGSDNDLLVNVIGGYSGTVLFDADAGEHSVAFEIEAEGAWTATISPLTATRAWPGSGALTGSGDDVVRVSPAISGLATATITYQGESNFIVTSYGSGGSDLVVNEIGNYSGESILPSGTFLLQIEAEGSWTITPG